MAENETSAEQGPAPDATPEVETAVEAADQPEVIEPRDWVHDWFEDWPRRFGRRLPERLRRSAPSVETINVEQYRDGNELVIRAELPGVDPDENIDVSVVGDRLTIAAHREQSEESKSDEGSRSEFHYGAFRRIMSLPAGVSADDVAATYDDGILEVRVPVGEEETPATQVPIERRS